MGESNDGFNEWWKERMNEWLKERMNDWRNEWKIEWANEWLMQGMKEWIKKFHHFTYGDFKTSKYMPLHLSATII